MKTCKWEGYSSEIQKIDNRKEDPGSPRDRNLRAALEKGHGVEIVESEMI